MMFLEGPKATISGIAFSPDGALLGIGTKDGKVAVANTHAGDVRTLCFGNTVIFTVVFDPTGTHILYGDSEWWSGLHVCGEVDRAIKGPKARTATAGLAFLNDQTLVIGYGDRVKAQPGQIELFNIRTGRRLEPFFREPAGVRAVAVHSASHHVAWANGSNRVSIWNTLTLEPRHVGLTHTSSSLAFHPDGESLAVALEWGAKIYDVKERTERAALKGHAGRVTSIAYSPDGRTLATASWDQSVRFWDAASGSLRATFEWGIGRVQALAFAPDGLRLAAGGENGMIAMWDVD